MSLLYSVTIMHHCFHHRENARSNIAHPICIYSCIVFVAENLQHSVLLLIIRFLECHSHGIILVLHSWLCEYRKIPPVDKVPPSGANPLPLSLPLLWLQTQRNALFLLLSCSQLILANNNQHSLHQALC